MCDCSDEGQIKEFIFSGEESLKVERVFNRGNEQKYFIGRADTMSGVVLALQQSKR